MEDLARHLVARVAAGFGGDVDVDEHLPLVRAGLVQAVMAAESNRGIAALLRDLLACETSPLVSPGLMLAAAVHGVPNQQFAMRVLDDPYVPPEAITACALSPTQAYEEQLRALDASGWGDTPARRYLLRHAVSLRSRGPSPR